VRGSILRGVDHVSIGPRRSAADKPAPTLYEYITLERKLVENVGIKVDLFTKNLSWLNMENTSWSRVKR
jgi:hypothetical protein